MANDFYVRDLTVDRVEAFCKSLLACLKELDTSPNHPVWFAARPPLAYLDPCPEPYLLIFLPGFEEEYFNHPMEGEDNTHVGVVDVES